MIDYLSAHINVFLSIILGNDYIVTDSRGYEFIILEEAKQFQQKIKLNQEVMKIERKSNMFRIVTSTWKSYFAKHVLVTFSSGVLQSNDIQFIPPLAVWKREALSLVPMCHYCKIYMNFPNSFWESSGYILLGAKHKRQYMHYQNYKMPGLFPDRNILVATITGDFCYQSQRLNDTEVTNQIMSTLRKVYGDVPYPTGPYNKSSTKWRRVQNTVKHPRLSFQQKKLFWQNVLS